MFSFLYGYNLKPWRDESVCFEADHSTVEPVNGLKLLQVDLCMIEAKKFEKNDKLPGCQPCALHVLVSKPFGY